MAKHDFIFHRFFCAKLGRISSAKPYLYYTGLCEILKGESEAFKLKVPYLPNKL